MSSRGQPRADTKLVYRYAVAHPRRFAFTLNRYGWRVIGVAVVIGRYAYCVKWERAS